MAEIAGWTSPRTLARRIAPVLAVTAPVLFALIVQWPNYARFSAVAVTLVCLATGALAAAGVLLWHEGTQQANAGLFVASAVLFAIDWSYTWPQSPLPVLAVSVGSLYAVALGTIFLRYPRARLARRSERWLVGIAAAWTLAGRTAFLVTSRPEWLSTAGQQVSLPSSTWWITLYPDMQLSQLIAGVTEVGQLLIVVVFAFMLGRRLMRESRVLRSELTPAYVGAFLLTSGIVFRLSSLVESANHPSAVSEERTAVVVSLTVMLIPATFVISATRQRLARAGIADLVLRLAPPVSTEEVRSALRETLGDDSLEIFYWVPDTGTFVDADGRPIPGEEGLAGVIVPVADRHGDLLAVVCVDDAFDRRRRLLNSAVAASALALENSRLEVALRAQLQEVRASRSRIVEAGLTERRRMERDLHDGVQQRLLSIGATLGRLEILSETSEARSAVNDMRTELRAAREELRDLARGLHPAVLTQDGLGPAIEAVTERLPLTVDVDVPDSRWREEVELSAYFVACEALTNAAKHSGIAKARIVVRETGGQLLLRVTDSGVGGAAFLPLGGLIGLRDRVRALGGELTIASPPGRGTEVTVRLPCE